MSKPKNPPTIIRPTEIAPDPAALQAAADRHLARRFRVSIEVAATVAGLAGIGPQFGRDTR